LPEMQYGRAFQVFYLNRSPVGWAVAYKP